MDANSESNEHGNKLEEWARVDIRNKPITDPLEVKIIEDPEGTLPHLDQVMIIKGLNILNTQLLTTNVPEKERQERLGQLFNTVFEYKTSKEARQKGEALPAVMLDRMKSTLIFHKLLAERRRPNSKLARVKQAAKSAIEGIG